MNWTQQQCDLAAADCAERLAKRLREGLPVASNHFAWLERIRVNAIGHADMDYAFLLASMNVPQLDVDVARAAIGAGCHPPDSLPGLVRKRHGMATDAALGGAGVAFEQAAVEAVHVLEWIGAAR